jgi:hypothetical protein
VSSKVSSHQKPSDAWKEHIAEQGRENRCLADEAEPSPGFQATGVLLSGERAC